MINGKKESYRDDLMDNAENNDIADVKIEEAMDIDNNVSDNISSSPRMENLLPLNQNNTNGCEVALTIKSEESNEISNEVVHDVVDDTGDLYADDDEARPTGTITHRFPFISQYKDLEPGREKKLLSEPIKIRCLPWKILVMFRVNTNLYSTDLKQRQMGVFLQCNADCESPSWNCNAKAKITLIAQRKCTGNELGVHTNNSESENPIGGDVVRTIEHNFYAKENDWGFSTFITLAELFSTEKGFVMDDSILIRISINADAPHGIDWDSKRHTGFVGLKNQGATCYLNSLLQTLYFTNKLRKAVYMMPTYSDEPSVSVPLALQRVFYELQFSEKSVGTKKLTRSFGWETLDSFMQHDAQELCRVLMDNMENKMKGTSVENMIPSMFCGKMLSYIKCKHVPVESTREENFYDIQLKVKNNNTIYEAFEEYICVETLDNENKYDAAQYGLQEAEKGVIFVTFPPVLYLQLMRFQFDFSTETNVKINDKFEFYAKLDLSKYLKIKSEYPVNYFLHAVLVHSGDNHGGHYVVYLNPRGDNKWYKFDDDVVSRCSAKEAIQMNYGGYEEDLGVRQCTNAYMLVYMSEKDRDDILCPVTEDDIPTPLLERFAKEHQIEAQKRREKAESHLFTCVYLLLEEDYYGWTGFDLCIPNEAPQRKVRVAKSASLDELIDQICEILNLPARYIRLWQMKPRKNGTTRVTVLEMKEGFLKQDIVIYLWVECIPVDRWMYLLSQQPTPESPVASDGHESPGDIDATENHFKFNTSLSIETILPFDINNDLLIFLKFYNYRTKSIHYIGHTFIRIHSKLAVLIPELLSRALLPDNTRLLIYEERKPQCLELLNPQASNEQNFEVIMDGNIVVYQERPPQHLLDSNSAAALEYQSVLSYFNDVFFQNDLLFIDKNHADDNQGFVLRLSGKSSYEDMARAVGHYLNYPHDRLQFFRSQFGFSNKELIGVCIKSNFDGEIKDLLTHYPRTKSHKRFYYEKLTMSVEELENMRQIHCFYVNEKLTEEVLYTVNLNRNATIRDLVISIVSQVKNIQSVSPRSRTENFDMHHDYEDDEDEHAVPPIDPRRYRVFEINNCKILQQFPLDTKVALVTTGVSRHLRVEPIPVEEWEIANNELLVFVAHFHKETYSTFGIPFAIKVRDGETYSNIKERIKCRLEVSDKEFDRWRFAIVSGRATYLPPDDGNNPANESVVSINAFHSHTFSAMTGARPWLGIEHKPTKRPRPSGCEKPIKIHN